MRTKLAGLAAALAVMLSAAPAMACYSSCSQGLFGAYGGGYATNYAPSYSQSYSGCCGTSYGPSSYSYGANSYSYGASSYDRLPDSSGPQYYYVNQGPTYTGPASLAPAPSYQERAVSGWQGYSRPYYSGYDGGPYGNATSHYYDGAPDVQGPAIYSYRQPRAYSRSHYRPRPRYYTSRYGYRGPRIARQQYGYPPYRAYRHGPLRSLN